RGPPLGHGRRQQRGAAADRRRRRAPARAAGQRAARDASSRGMAPRIANLPEWRAHLLDRLGRQAVVSGDPALAALHEELAALPGGEGGHHAPDLAAGEIAVPLRIRHGDRELRFISTYTTFGTAVDV